MLTINEYFEEMKRYKDAFEKCDDVQKQECVKEIQGRLPEYEKLFWCLFDDIKREGVDKLKAFIKKSDFMEAPASTKYHSDFKGGLLIHTLNVYCCFYFKKQSPLFAEIMKDITDEQIALLTLCHDVHKLYFYANSVKNKKIYSDGGSKYDEMGRFDWVAVPSYTVEDKYPLGGGEKSVIFLMQFCRLKMAEIMALRWHHGFSVSKDDFMLFEDAMKRYPLVLALHQADVEAAKILEVTL